MIDPPVAERGVEFRYGLAGVSNDGNGAVLHRVEPSGVDRDELRFRAERRPRAGGEILQPRADGEDHVGVGGERVGRGRADDADRAGVRGVAMREPALAGDGLDNGDAVLDGEIRDDRLGQRIANAATGDKDGLFRRLQ